ncbi:DDB1- and CUL4-associated factor 5 [Portunus trituberculatus]|uniref:DDB1-and CUL4-associated factor 5 n=1 Tax=Portunus trituberculatus TaxID=210409 RepID=A0A5B7I7T2_PORTR|nr:DDB1- and CUL4-associated factor 5 [Portunus trituberculatus]
MLDTGWNLDEAGMEFDAEHYYNSCTMKSCCFAGDNDQFVLSGSDDFNLYMWKIPERNSSSEC